MCITFFSIHPNKKYKFLLLFNRDELLSRQSLSLDFHNTNPLYKDILFYPLDCAYGGTFLCINTKNGNFCCLLNNNFETIPFNPDAKYKRGDIPLEFCRLDSNSTEWENFFKFLENNKYDYNGFNLICGNLKNEEYYYYTNNYENTAGTESNQEIKIPYKFKDSGVYGVSNDFLDRDSIYKLKVDYGKNKLKEILNISGDIDEQELIKQLFSLMGDKIKLNQNFTHDEVNNMIEKDGLKVIFYKKVKSYICSSVFLDDKLGKYLLNYGTRHTICIMCDYENNLKVYEYCDPIHYQSRVDTSQDSKNMTEENSSLIKEYFIKERNLEEIKKFEFKLNDQ